MYYIDQDEDSSFEEYARPTKPAMSLSVDQIRGSVHPDILRFVDDGLPKEMPTTHYSTTISHDIV